ncbi:hypothetical protein HYY74_03210 [Candidatus Woesearchaeota archaeon]|nr:hypothetical protein [Candidatus Woesearchaeota archaeon]
MKHTSRPTAAEKRKYVLRTAEDREILAKCKALEALRLSRSDKLTVKLIKSQLIREWRNPLIKKLNQIARKYK